MKHDSSSRIEWPLAGWIRLLTVRATVRANDASWPAVAARDFLHTGPHFRKASRVQVIPMFLFARWAEPRQTLSRSWRRWASASPIVSAAETSNMRRPFGKDPWRNDIMTRPPSTNKSERVPIARRRWTSSRCIQTAVTMTALNVFALSRTRQSSGRLSSSQTTLEVG